MSFNCAQCELWFQHRSDLDKHFNETGHGRPTRIRKKRAFLADKQDRVRDRSNRGPDRSDPDKIKRRKQAVAVQESTSSSIGPKMIAMTEAALEKMIATRIKTALIEERKKQQLDAISHKRRVAFLKLNFSYIAKKQLEAIQALDRLQMRTDAWNDGPSMTRNPIMPNFHRDPLADGVATVLLEMKVVLQDLLVSTFGPEWNHSDNNETFLDRRGRLGQGLTWMGIENVDGGDYGIITVDHLFNQDHERNCHLSLFKNINPTSRAAATKELMRLVLPELEAREPPYWMGARIRCRPLPWNNYDLHENQVADLTYRLIKDYGAVRVTQAPRHRGQLPTFSLVDTSANVDAPSPCEGAANLPVGGDKMCKSNARQRLINEAADQQLQGHRIFVHEDDLKPNVEDGNDNTEALKRLCVHAAEPSTWFLGDFDMIDDPDPETARFVNANFRPPFFYYKTLVHAWYIKKVKDGYMTLYIITYGDGSDIKGTWSCWIGCSQTMFLSHQHDLAKLKEDGVMQQYIDAMTWDKHIDILAASGAKSVNGSAPLAHALACQFVEDEVDLGAHSSQVINWKDIQSAITHSAPAGQPLPNELTFPSTFIAPVNTKTGYKIKTKLVGTKGDFKEHVSTMCTMGPGHGACRAYSLCDGQHYVLGWPAWLADKKTTRRAAIAYDAQGATNYAPNNPRATIVSGGINQAAKRREVEARRSLAKGFKQPGVPWSTPDGGETKKELDKELMGQKHRPVFLKLSWLRPSYYKRRSVFMAPDFLHIFGELEEKLYKLLRYRKDTDMRECMHLWLMAIHARKHGKMRKVDWHYVLNALLLPSNYHPNALRPDFNLSDNFIGAACALLECFKYSNRKAIVSSHYANHLGWTKAHEDFLFYLKRFANTDTEGNVASPGVYPATSGVTEQNLLGGAYLDGAGAGVNLDSLVTSISDTRCDQEERIFQTIKKDGINTNNTFKNFRRQHDKHVISRGILNKENKAPRRSTRTSRLTLEYNAMVDMKDPRYKSFASGLSNRQGEYIGEVHTYEIDRVHSIEHVVATLFKRPRMIFMYNEPAASGGASGNVVEWWRGVGEYNEMNVRGWELLCDMTVNVPVPNVAYWNLDTTGDVCYHSYTTLVLENSTRWEFPGFKLTASRIFWFEIIQHHVDNKKPGWEILLKKLLQCRCSLNIDGKLQLPRKAQRLLTVAIGIQKELDLEIAKKKAALREIIEREAREAREKKAKEDEIRAAEEQLRVAEEKKAAEEKREREEKEAAAARGVMRTRRVRGDWKSKYSGQSDWS